MAATNNNTQNNTQNNAQNNENVQAQAQQRAQPQQKNVTFDDFVGKTLEEVSFEQVYKVSPKYNVKSTIVGDIENTQGSKDTIVFKLPKGIYRPIYSINKKVWTKSNLLSINKKTFEGFILETAPNCALATFYRKASAKKRTLSNNFVVSVCTSCAISADFKLHNEGETMPFTTTTYNSVNFGIEKMYGFVMVINADLLTFYNEMINDGSAFEPTTEDATTESDLLAMLNNVNN